MPGIWASSGGGSSGPVNIVARGAWSSLTTYALNDVVSGTDGNSYISLANTNLNHAITLGGSNAWWAPFATGSVGPQGQNSSVPIVFSQPGTLSVSTGTQGYIADRDYIILGVVAYVNTPGGTQPIIVQLEINTVPIFTSGNRPSIAAGANSSGSKVPDVTTSLLTGQVLTCDVAQIGISPAGSDITVIVTAAAALPLLSYRQTGDVASYTLSNADVGGFVDCQNTTALMQVHIPNGLVQGTTTLWVSGTKAVQVVANASVTLRPSQGSFFTQAVAGLSMAVQLFNRNGGVDFYALYGATS